METTLQRRRIYSGTCIDCNNLFIDDARHNILPTYGSCPRRHGATVPLPPPRYRCHPFFGHRLGTNKHMPSSWPRTRTERPRNIFSSQLHPIDPPHGNPPFPIPSPRAAAAAAAFGSAADGATSAPIIAEDTNLPLSPVAKLMLHPLPLPCLAYMRLGAEALRLRNEQQSVLSRAVAVPWSVE